MLSNSVLVLGKCELRKVHPWPLLKDHFLIVLCFYKKVIVLCYKTHKSNKTSQVHCIQIV